MQKAHLWGKSPECLLTNRKLTLIFNCGHWRQVSVLIYRCSYVFIQCSLFSLDLSCTRGEVVIPQQRNQGQMSTIHALQPDKVALDFRVWHQYMKKWVLEPFGSQLYDLLNSIMADERKPCWIMRKYDLLLLHICLPPCVLWHSHAHSYDMNLISPGQGIRSYSLLQLQWRF